MSSRPGRRLPPPLTVTDQYLAAILDELRAVGAQLVQEPATTTGRQVTEPVQEPGR